MVEPLTPRGRTVLLLCLLLLVTGLAAYAPKAVEESHRADFERYYHAGCTALSGGDVYAAKRDLQYKYLPFFAQCMAPVAWLAETMAGSPTTSVSDAGLRVGAAIWYRVLYLSYFGSLLLAVLMCRPGSWKHALAIGVVGLALSVRFFVGNIRNGQINMPVMFLAVLGCWLLLNGRDCLAGIAVGLGAMIKFMPIVLLLWFIGQKRWWAVVYTLATVLAALILIPSLTWGASGNWSLLERYVTSRHKMVTSLPKEEAAGQSLPSMTNRLLRRVNATNLRRKEPLYINVADVDPRTAKAVAGVLVLLVCMACWRSCRGEKACAGTVGALQAGAMFLLLLLISPEARKAHFATVLVPACALMNWQLAASRRRWVWWGLGLGFVLMVIPNRDLFDSMGARLVYDYLNAYGIVLWGAIALFVTTLHLLQAETPQSVER